MSVAQIARPLPVRSRSLASSLAEKLSIPWTILLIVAGICTIQVALIFDNAWHMSIGRDSMWIPPHICMQISGVLMEVACIFTILSTTFAGSPSERDASVKILGLSGPGGAFIVAWSCLAMLATAPFDNWWHSAYGLDVKALVPPHALAILGSFVCNIGAMAWIAGIINRSQEKLQGRLAWLMLIVGAIGVAGSALLTHDATLFQNMHTARCYLAVAILTPCMMIAPGWASLRKWGCTIAAAIYMLIGLAAEWLLPLIPAQPKLGPVYHNITHLVPPKFPLLLIVPALVADLLLQRLAQRSPWVKAACVGPAFVLSFLAVQWPFANFLISPASRNWIFGTAYFAYVDPAAVLYDPYKFNVAEKTPGAFIVTMVIALIISIVSTRLGLAWGDWMRRIRR